MALNYAVFVTPPIPQHSGTLNLPTGEPIAWSPTATTLIYGDRGAVLVDPPFTHTSVDALMSWIQDFGVPVTKIYITHGHGDHWFGVSDVLKRYPGATVWATAGTLAHIRDPALEQQRAEFWDVLFPDEIPAEPFEVNIVDSGGFDLEGHKLVPVEVGHSDSDDTTVLWVPELRLAVAGDVVYNGVHLSLAESASGGRDEWRKALETVASLSPLTVVAGHKDPLHDDDPRHVALTRQYLDDVDDQLLHSHSSAQFFEAMISLYPDRLNPGVLWVGANSLLNANGS